MRPYFFVAAASAEVAALGVVVEATTLTALDGTPVARVTTTLPGDVPPLRQRLGAAGITCYEADLRFAYTYLRDRDLRGAITIAGSSQSEGRIRRVYRNPDLAPTDFTPNLRVLSLDIETDLRATEVYAIGLAGLGADRVLMVGPGPLRGAECFPNERAVLERFFVLLDELDATC